MWFYGGWRLRRADGASIQEGDLLRVNEKNEKGNK